MSTKSEYIQAIKETHRKFNDFLDSIPASDYTLPSDNPAWTIGDDLYHITLGPQTVGFEIRMTLKYPRLFQLFLRILPMGLFNAINARLVKRKQLTKEELRKAYHLSHVYLLNQLRAVKEEDLQKTIVFPAFEPTITGKVSIADLLKYASHHFEIHAEQITRTLDKKVFEIQKETGDEQDKRDKSL